MKTIRPLFIAVALLLTFSSAYSQTADENAKEFEKQSMMIIQKLYSCQSMAYTVIGDWLIQSFVNDLYSHSLTAYTVIREWLIQSLVNGFHSRS